MAAKQKTGPKFLSPTDKERVLAEVMRLDRMRYSQWEIAGRVGISQGQVSIYLKQQRQKYAAARMTDVAEHVAEKLEQYDDVIKQAAEAFERSKTRVVVDENGEEKELPTTPEAVFLAKVMDALKAQRELLGLDAPTKTDVRAAVVTAEVKPEDVAALSGRPPRSDVLAEAVGRETKALPAHEPGTNGRNGKHK